MTNGTVLDMPTRLYYLKPAHVSDRFVSFGDSSLNGGIYAFW